MCEIMQKYEKIAAEKAAIKTTIEEAIEYGASKEKTIQRLMKKFNFSEAEAAEQYEMYAPALA